MRSLPRTAPETREAFYRAARAFSVEVLAEGPVAELAREALRSCGKIQKRKCLLQPLFVLWFLLARPLFPGDSLTTLFSRLARALRGRIQDLDDRMVTDGALCHARDWLGTEPLEELLRALADVPGPRFHRRRVLALDGVRLDIPDTPANSLAFGRRRSQRGASPWPQSLSLVLLDVATRIPLAARVTSCHSSEKVVGRDLLCFVGPQDILLLDAGFYGVPFFLAVHVRGAGFLCPVPRHVLFDRHGRPRVRGPFTDYTATLRSRVVLPDGRTKTLWMDVRVIEERRPGFRTRRYVTNLPTSIPAEEVVQLYRERWEVEMAFDEIKTVLCHPTPGGTPTELRSKSPEGVRQEVFALLCTYSLIRRTMATAAQAERKDPRDLSFTAALACIAQTATTMLAAPASALVGLYERMLGDIAACTLRRPGTPRRCRREVKRKSNKYPIKQPRRGVAA